MLIVIVRDEEGSYPLPQYHYLVNTLIYFFKEAVLEVLFNSRDEGPLEPNEIGICLGEVPTVIQTKN